MEEPAPAPRKDAYRGHGPERENGPDQVVYRRRQEDWLSGESHPGREPRGTARLAAIEVAKATLVARDGLTSDHSDDVGLLCTAIANQLNLAEQAKSNLMAAAQLHDIGKLAVPESILQKPAPLDESEWEVIREHTIVGERILSAVPELIDIAGLVRHSHEHWDGSGYPDGLSGERIPLESRIILCADAFHAVRSPRPYRDGRSAAEAYGEIKANSGRQFDPDVVEALGRTIEGVRKRRRSGRPSFSTRAVLGNRRLAALLLTLAVAGSAFAALGGGISGDDLAEASPESGCANCFTLPAAAFDPAPGAGTKAASAARRREARARAARRSANAAASTGRGSAPQAGGGPAAGAPRAPAAARPPGGRAGSAAPAPVVGGGFGPAPAKVTKPKKVKSPPPRGNAYGQQKRLENPNPPKPPPGLVKPKPNR